MSAKIQKWGNSLAVRLPKNLIEKLNLTENSAVDIDHKDGAIVITRATQKYSLSSLLAGIHKDNCHSEDGFVPEGDEVW